MADTVPPINGLLLRLTEEERRVVREFNTPPKIQVFLDSLPYAHQEGISGTMRSFRGVLRDKEAHCFEGAVTAAALRYLHGHAPLLLCMEAADIDHNLAVYWSDDKVGSLGTSRQQELRQRAPLFPSYSELVRSYLPHYYDIRTGNHADLTLRGFAVVDLRIFGEEWITRPGDLRDIERYLYTLPYQAIVDFATPTGAVKPGDFYYSLPHHAPVKDDVVFPSLSSLGELP